MIQDNTIGVLVEWRDLLLEVASIEIHLDLETDDIQKRLVERQSSIEKIQKLDGSIRNLAEERHRGWPGFGKEIPHEAEKIIQEGIEICNSVVERDKQLVDIARKNRHGILKQLKEAGLGKGYLASSYQPKIRPPVIVDSSV